LELHVCPSARSHAPALHSHEAVPHVVHVMVPLLAQVVSLYAPESYLQSAQVVLLQRLVEHDEFAHSQLPDAHSPSVVHTSPSAISHVPALHSHEACPQPAQLMPLRLPEQLPSA
jgi:hypothetical protein